MGTLVLFFVLVLGLVSVFAGSVGAAGAAGSCDKRNWLGTPMKFPCFHLLCGAFGDLLDIGKDGGRGTG